MAKNKLYEVLYTQGCSPMLSTYEVAINPSMAKNKVKSRFRYELSFDEFNTLDMGGAKEIKVSGYKINLEKIVE